MNKLSLWLICVMFVVLAVSQGLDRQMRANFIETQKAVNAHQETISELSERVADLESRLTKVKHLQDKMAKGLGYDGPAHWR